MNPLGKREKALIIAVCALAVVLIVVLVSVLAGIDLLGPEHSGVIAVSVLARGTTSYGTREFVLYVDEHEVASGTLSWTVPVPFGYYYATATRNLTVEWSGNSTHHCDLAMFYNGNLYRTSLWLADRQITTAKFEV